MYTKSLESLFDNVADMILEQVAVEGLEILRKLLADSGFLHSEFLKNYALSSRIDDGAIIFEISIDIEAFSEESKAAVEEVETPIEDPTDPNSYTIPTLPSRVFARAKRIFGRPMGGARDARQSFKKNNDARVPMSDARRDARKTAFDRKVARDVSAPAPRKMRVDRQGKLVVAFRKQMEEANGEYQYPQGDFEGIIGKFLSELESLLVEKFTPMLEEVIMRNLS